MRACREIPNRTNCEASHIRPQPVVLLGLVDADARLDATSFFGRVPRRMGPILLFLRSLQSVRRINFFDHRDGRVMAGGSGSGTGGGTA